MPFMADQIAALAVGANSGNVLAGRIYEFAVRSGAVIEVAAACDVFGVRCTLTTGTDVLLLNEALVSVKAGAVPLVYPDDYVFNDIVASAERITLSFFNASLAARIVTWSVKVTPL